jgi:Protein of unknown function (DUF3592)
MRAADEYILGAITIITAIVTTTNAAFAEAVIDRGAKPYFIAGGVVATVFFVSVGAMLIRKGQRLLRIAAAAAQWPIVTGKVISADIVRRIDKSEDGPSTVFVPQVRYVFDADGVRRDGHVIRIGLEDRGYAREQQASELLTRYAVGAKIAVRYDPQNPATAVLELGQVGGGANLLAGVLLMLVGIGAIAFTVFSMVTPSQ